MWHTFEHTAVPNGSRCQKHKLNILPEIASPTPTTAICSLCPDHERKDTKTQTKQTKQTTNKQANEQTNTSQPNYQTSNQSKTDPDQTKPNQHTKKENKQTTINRTNKQTNKQASKQAKKQRNKETTKQASKPASKQASKQTNKQTNIHTHIHMCCPRTSVRELLVTLREHGNSRKKCGIKVSRVFPLPRPRLHSKDLGFAHGCRSSEPVQGTHVVWDKWYGRPRWG